MLQLVSLLPVKQSVTVSNILIDKKAIIDLILDDEGENFGTDHLNCIVL